MCGRAEAGFKLALREGSAARLSKLPDRKARNELTGVRWIEVAPVILNDIAHIYRESGGKQHDEFPGAVERLGENTLVSGVVRIDVPIQCTLARSYHRQRLGPGREPSHPRLSDRNDRRCRLFRHDAAFDLLLPQGRQLVFARLARRRLR